MSEKLLNMELLHQEQFSLDDAKKIYACITQRDPESAWQEIARHILTSTHSFQQKLFLFSLIFPDWETHPECAPVWIPTSEEIKKTHLSHFMKELNKPDFDDFHQWTVNHFELFWEKMIDKLQIRFHQKPTQICDLKKGIESPVWLPHAKMNIADSCFNAAGNKIALVFQTLSQEIQKITYDELNQLSNRIAHSLLEHGFSAGDAIAINMPMSYEAVAIYLGIIKMGGIVVSIADSFSPEEMKVRLDIAKTKGIFTQDIIFRGEKKIPLYEKVLSANAPRAIVVSVLEKISVTLREKDMEWKFFLGKDESPISYSCDPMSPCNILFSSGTTGTPKAIPWNHTTAIKAAADAYLHQDVNSTDILAWPTNLGWMMGPWLIFAALVNQATMALYTDSPNDSAFGKFIQEAGVTFLGVVPTLVNSWRQTHCMETWDWKAIRVFSSSGECSNPEDMFYLMSLAHFKPIIEYCGGTEIGGAYITSTLIQKNYASLLTTPTMGLDFVLLDEKGHETNQGEVALIPPSMGLSTELMNADHHKIYFAEMPKCASGKILRRHGDQICRLPNHCYSMLGRVDDTMNLSGIKTSSAEIERVLTHGIENIGEIAAIACNPLHGPSQLIIYVTTSPAFDKNTVKQKMQQCINQHLNPLFKIHDVVFIPELPKTASNKIMRRVLRDSWLAGTVDSISKKAKKNL